MPGASPAVSALKLQGVDACLEASAATWTKRAEHYGPRSRFTRCSSREPGFIEAVCAERGEKGRQRRQAQRH